MTPEILINWIIEGRIYDEVKGSGDYAEDGRYVWPERMEMIVKWAKDAKEPVIQADADSRENRPDCPTCGGRGSYKIGGIIYPCRNCKPRGV